ncbi:hypothetical protein ABE545_04385 [Sphingobacterium faecium]|uniref:hypothetical protein n=1 Tax=Sphingobacterium faecium TaxID=34087 RepID=UPI003207DF8B
MNELDQFKKQWKENENFMKLNQSEIKAILHKSSTSIVKWIFIICCLELLLGITLSFILPSEKEEFLAFELLNWTYEIISYIAIFYFIYIFFKLLKKIKNTNNTKSLMEAILAVRKNADHYIKFNLWCINYVIIISLLHNIVAEFYESHSWSMVLFILILGSILSFTFGYVFIKLAKGYYHLIYGKLLKKLNHNYEELTRLEEES